MLNNHKILFSNLYPKLVFISASMFLLFGKNAMCQNNEEVLSKKPVFMNISYKISDGIKHVKVQVTKKENKKIISVHGAKSPVVLYLNDVKVSDPANGTGLIGKLFLNYDGEVVFDFSEKFNTLTSKLHKYKFIARMESDPFYEDAQQEITISEAMISIEYFGKDSIKTATATLIQWKDSEYIPVVGIEMKLFIKRSFSLFPFGESGLTTNKEGKVSGDLPLDIPGEAGGKITIVASIIDNEDYGTIESTKKVDWNIFPKKNEEIGRTLWASGKNAPIPLVLASCSIIILIWGIIIYIISRLFYIKKIGKEQA